MGTNLTENLRSFFSVVEVEVGTWRSATRADDMHWNLGRISSLLNLGKRLSVSGFVLNQELPVILLIEDFFLESGGSVSGGLGSTKKLR